MYEMKSNFWETLGIFAASNRIATKSMAVSIMARRIADEGSNLDEGLKLQIAKFLYDNQEDVVQN